MKHISVRVSDSDDVVYHNDKPHRLENIAFHRDEVHNCQMVMYATISPLIKGLDLDTVQLKSDMDSVCCYCADPVGEGWRMENGKIYCCDDCFNDHVYGDYPEVIEHRQAIVDDILGQQFEDIWYCDYCDGRIPDSRVDVGEICCSDLCDLLNGTA